MAIPRAPKWLFPLLQAEFRTARTANCDATNYGFFCMTCMGDPMNEIDYKRGHRTHKILRAVKASHHFAVKVDDVREKLCCKDVAKFSVNRKGIFFLNSRVNPAVWGDEGVKRNKRRRTEESARACVVCSWKLPDTSRYCSLGCKFARTDSYVQPNEGLNRMDGATKGMEVSFAAKTNFSFRKRSRKQIFPERSYLF